MAYKDSVYIIDSKMRCLDVATGKEKWSGGEFGGDSTGNCIVAAGDNKVIGFGGGHLVLLEASAPKYAELARVDGLVSGKCYPGVALADGFIVVKDEKGAVVCLSTKK